MTPLEEVETLNADEEAAKGNLIPKENVDKDPGKRDALNDAFKNGCRELGFDQYMFYATNLDAIKTSDEIGTGVSSCYMAPEILSMILVDMLQNLIKTSNPLLLVLLSLELIKIVEQIQEIIKVPEGESIQ